ncbi:MAG: hypothetical protein IJL87_03635 [Clostridia bacterium]|nr:hypothetical protein [Clostridia bacterium]
MIVLANSRDIPALKDFCAGDAVGCRIGCNIDSYKTNLPLPRCGKSSKTEVFRE